MPPSAPPIPAGLETKNTGLAAVLALIPGFFGLWGVGHIYVGKIGKGLALLILGIMLEWVFGFSVFLAMMVGGIFGGYRYGLPGLIGGILAVAVIFILVTFAIFVWQVYDAYRLAKYYNEYVQQYRKAPW